MILSFSTPGKMVSACPLAFGEVGVKQRIRAVLNYKKPAFWVIVIAVIPYVFNGIFGASVSSAGTSLIIIVSVILETVKQIESQMLVRNYKGFLES